MPEPLLQVDNLKMYFPVRSGIFLRQAGWVKAVDDVSFNIYPGETLGLVGESGCGKSTIGKSIVRLLKPTGGSIRFNGNNIARLSQRKMRPHRMGTPAARREWVRGLLDRVGLPDSAIDRFPFEFSGGQRQRIGIARALTLNPSLIILDEPVSALDVSVQSQVLNLLRNANSLTCLLPMIWRSSNTSPTAWRSCIWVKSWKCQMRKPSINPPNMLTPRLFWTLFRNRTLPGPTSTSLCRETSPLPSTRRSALLSAIASSTPPIRRRWERTLPLWK